MVVGIDEYGFPSPRAGMAAQVLAFAEWLRDRDVPAANIVLLTSPLLPDAKGMRNLEATSNNVQNVLYRDIPSLDGDFFWLHWGGHGATDQRRHPRLFVSDAKSDDLRNLDLDELGAFYQTDQVRRLGQQIFTVDACQKFPGARTPALPDGIPAPPGGTMDSNIWQEMLLAAPRGERAVHLSRLGGGVFTAALLEVVQELPTREWPSDLGVLAAQVKRRAELLAPDHPGAQHPISVSHTDHAGARKRFEIVPPPSLGVLGQNLVDQFFALCDQEVLLDESTMLGALWRAADTVAPIPVDNDLTIRSLLTRLNELPTRARRLPPVLSFVEHLAARLRDPVPLQDWVDKMAVELALDQALVQRTRTGAAHAGPDDLPTYVVIRVESIPGSDNLFRVNASIERDHVNLTFRADDQTDCHIDNVQTHCESLVSRISRFLPPEVPAELVTFEFWLPWSLLNVTVHAWRPASQGQAATQLGLRGKVVVRSLDRLRYDGLSRRDWQARWKRMIDGSASETLPRIMFLHRISSLPDYYDSKQQGHLVITQQSLDEISDRFTVANDVVCLMLSYPYEGRADLTVDGLRAAVAAGLPAAVWCGAGYDSASLKTVLEELTTKGNLSSLPEQVLLDRRAAMNSSNPDHFGRDLSLLWDDPGRIVELTTPLSTPATKETLSK